MSGNGGGRSAEEKEKTKMRERQRRSVTTKIFNGLRKHGGYHLSSRADINEVLRQLAKEAGWIVEPDGTTYRSSSSAAFHAPDPCPLCGTGKISRTTTPASSVVICSEGDCSTAASPHPVPIAYPMTGLGGSAGSLYNHGAPCTPFHGGGDGENPLAMYMYQRLTGVSIPTSGNPSEVPAGYQQLMYFQEARASNQNTPVASPRRL